MINVTIGESKTQEKPFPKLMIGSSGSIIEVLSKPDIDGFSNVIIRKSDLFTNGKYKEKFLLNGVLETFENDYNEPITLQNA